MCPQQPKLSLSARCAAHFPGYFVFVSKVCSSFVEVEGRGDGHRDLCHKQGDLNGRSRSPTDAAFSLPPSGSGAESLLTLLDARGTPVPQFVATVSLMA